MSVCVMRPGIAYWVWVYYAHILFVKLIQD